MEKDIYMTYLYDARLTYEEKGLLSVLELEKDNFIGVCDLLGWYKKEEDIIELLDTLEAYDYIIRKPCYKETDFHDKIFSSWVYKFNEVRTKEKS